MNDIMGNIEQLWETNIYEVPKDSRFLLELKFDQLIQSDIHNKTHWMVATEAAILGG